MLFRSLLSGDGTLLSIRFDQVKTISLDGIHLRDENLTPYHADEYMLRLARAGAVVLPAAPGFYHRPESIDALVDFIVARILDQLGVEHAIGRRWA